MRIKKLISIFLALSLSLTLFAKNSLEEQNNGDSGSTTIKEKKLEGIKGDRGQYDGLPIVEGRTHRAGMLRLTIPNNGQLGNADGLIDPCTNQTAASGEMPAGSDVEFLFMGSMWFGGYLDSAKIEVGSNNTEATIFQGPLVSTGFEGWAGSMKEMWPVNVSPEFGTLSNSNIVERSNIKGRQNCLFEDVYDPTATAEEQFDVMYSDKYVSSAAPSTGTDPSSGRAHIPLGVEVKQKSYAWSYEYAQKFVIIDYTLYNRSEDADGNPRDIYNFFMAEYFDMDIGDTRYPGITDWHGDDIGGFFEVWEDYIDPATQVEKAQVLNLAWAADNDGRHYMGAANNNGMSIDESDGPIEKENGIVTIRVLRNPNPNLEFSFNNYTAASNALDNWGPRWADDLHSYYSPSTEAIPWAFDLMPKQRGYDDGNQGYPEYHGANTGGQTEGCALTDIGRYMVISNGEFDYDQTKLNDINFSNPNLVGELKGEAVEYVEPYRINPTHDQQDKWKLWDHNADGTIEVLNNIQNGRDTKMILSFGPLGRETTVQVATDADQNGTIDSFIDKDVNIFEYGDSLKLTIAFIVNENFHTDQTQDPRDGIIEEKFQQGWYDALYNVVWAERVYDIPMFDTPVDYAGLLKGDGWFGEDVGSDGLYAEENGDICWWTGTVYNGRDEDGTEQNNEKDVFNAGLVDIYGEDMLTEDVFLKYGNTSIVTEDIGLTVDYGYRIKDADGNWVRYGYIDSLVNQGDGVPDFTGPPPPPSPLVTTTYDDSDITTEWFSHEYFVTDGDTIITGPENTRDKFSKVVDFEGYQIMLSPDDQAQNYVEIFAVDRVNYGYESATESGDFLDQPFATSDTSGVIHADGTLWNLTEFGDNNSMYEDYETSQYTFESDSIGIVINEEGDEETFWRYRFTLKDRQYAKVNFLAITSSDFGDPQTGTPALKSSPTINGASITPTKISGDDKVYVVPNPYRADVDYSASWESTNGTWFEDDRKIVFLNIPERSVIKIYTLAGDLVKSLGHNNKARTSEKYAENGESWNLINDNEQAVTSGIYLFNVKDLDDDAYDFVGKFVIIK